MAFPRFLGAKVGEGWTTRNAALSQTHTETNNRQSRQLARRARHLERGHANAVRKRTHSHGAGVEPATYLLWVIECKQLHPAVFFKGR